MTRVERLNKRGKVEKKKTFKRVIKGLIKTIVCFVVGFVYLIYLIIHNFDLLVAKIYSKLPRLMRVAIVYSLVICSLYGIYKPNNDVVVKEEVLKINFVQKDNSVETITDEQVKVIEQSNQVCSYGEIECKIYNKAIETGLTKEQALLIVSISKHETGNWTSNAFKNKNNFGGVMCNSGLKKYATFEDGLNGFVNLLKNRYFNKGLNTIEQIGAVYCPVGATNDPTGVNQYWIPNVTNYYNEYLNK